MQNAEILALAGLRVDGRKANELRIMKHNMGFDKTGSSDGSIYMEHGLNKIVVMVCGPHEMLKRSESQNLEKGKIVCKIQHGNAYGSNDRKKKRGVSLLFLSFT